MRLGNHLLLGAFLAALPLLPAGASSPPFPLGPAFPIGGSGTSDPAATGSAQGATAVAWSYVDGKPGENTAIGARLYDADGQQVANMVVAASPTLGSPVLYPSAAIGSDGSLVVSWTANDTDGDGVFARFYDSSGIPAGTVILVNQTVAGSQAVSRVARTPSGGFVAVWAGLPGDGSSTAVYGRLFGATGQPLGGEVQLNTTTAGFQHGAVVAALGNGFVAAWHVTSGSVFRIFAQRLAADLSKIGPEIALSDLAPEGSSYLPELAVSPDPAQPIFALAWGGPASTQFGVRVQRFDQDGKPLGEPELASSLTFDQLDPSLIFDGAGGLLVSWTDHSQPGPAVVRARRLSTLPGPPLSPIFEVAPLAGRSSLAPLADGDFLVAFEYSPTEQVYGRRFSATMIFADGFESGDTTGWN